MTLLAQMGELYGKAPHWWIWGDPQGPDSPPHPAHLLFDIDATELLAAHKNKK